MRILCRTKKYLFFDGSAGLISILMGALCTSYHSISIYIIHVINIIYSVIIAAKNIIYLVMNCLSSIDVFLQFAHCSFLMIPVVSLSSGGTSKDTCSFAICRRYMYIYTYRLCHVSYMQMCFAHVSYMQRCALRTHDA